MSSTLAQLTQLTEELSNQYDISYAEALAAKQVRLDDLSDRIPTNQRAILFPFIYNGIGVQTLQEGEPPVYQTLVGEYVRIAVKKFSASAAIKRLDYNDPTFQSLLIKRVQGLGTQMAHNAWKRLIDALRLGDTDTYYTMYDGKQLFSDTHSINGITFDNKRTGVLSATTLNEAITLLQTVPYGPSGAYLPMVGARFYLVVDPSNFIAARQLVSSAWIGDTNGAQIDNQYRGLAEIIVDEQLSGAPGTWYLIAALPNNKPFVTIQNNTAPGSGLVSEINANDDAVKNFDEFRWSWTSFEESFPTQFFQMVKYIN